MDYKTKVSLENNPKSLMWIYESENYVRNHEKLIWWEVNIWIVTSPKWLRIRKDSSSFYENTLEALIVDMLFVYLYGWELARFEERINLLFETIGGVFLMMDFDDGHHVY